MRAMLLKLSTFLLFFALSGCVIFPHRQATVPEIRGTILGWPEPIKSAEVFFVRPNSSDISCEVPSKAAAVSENGNVYIESESELNFIISIGDPIANWELCLRNNGHVRRLWRNSQIGFVPKSINFECDLSQEEHYIDSPPFSGYGICTFKTQPS